MNHTGSCHCGRIAFSVEGEIGTVIDCNCSICRRRGHLLAFFPRSALTLHTPEADLATYTFNRHAIRHRFCPVCGVTATTDILARGLVTGSSAAEPQGR